jgi:transposase
MRKTREILRLKYAVGLSNRQIARSCGLTHPTVAHYLERAAQAGFTWPLPEEVDEDRLEELLFPTADCGEAARRPLPDLARIHQELRRPHVTLQLLWEEYRAEHPDGYGYTQFCEHYNRWKAPLEVTLRQRHLAGEKTFLDWAGKPLSWTDPATGQIHPAYLFVAVLGASDYTFAHAFADQRLPSWIEAHIQAVEFFGGVTHLWVPDNAKTGVDHPCYYEPQINATYQELADHYGAAILPTRPYAARDKAKVEQAVLQAERRILALLRHQTFFSVAEINGAIGTCLTELNQQPFQKMPGSRRQLFEELDQPALRPLPIHRYEWGIWRQAKVNLDYHVQVDWHFYSVPYTLTQQSVEVRLSVHTVEIFHKGRRVAAHARSPLRGGCTTDPAHRPKSHQKHLEWTPGRLIDWAYTIGPQCGQAITHLLQSKPHPEQGYRACLGIMRLARGYGQLRLEAACRRALALDACSYRSIHSILQAKLDQQPLPNSEEGVASPVSGHDNLRGQAYYQVQEPSTNGPPTDSVAGAIPTPMPPPD